MLKCCGGGRSRTDKKIGRALGLRVELQIMLAYDLNHVLILRLVVESKPKIDSLLKTWAQKCHKLHVVTHSCYGIEQMPVSGS